MLRVDTPLRQGWGRAARRRLQSLAFAALYGPGARLYDAFTRRLFLGEWARWQQAALPFLPAGGLIVELGSGTGALARLGATPARHWLGIERSASMVAVARRRTRVGGPWFVRADVAAVPVADESVDAVVAAFPTRYILDPRTAAEVRRVLKPDGRCVIVLSGTLVPSSLGRRARRMALDSFYGRGQARSLVRFDLVGFAGGMRRVSTSHGMAEIYVGRPRARMGSGIR